eukprot:s7582_g3.t1
MNGASDGRSEKGAGGHQAHGLASARNVVIEEGPRGSGAVFSQMTGDVQETQTRTDIGAQGTTSGVVFAATLPAGVSEQTASYTGEHMTGSFFTPRSSRGGSLPREGVGSHSGPWPGWIAKLGDMFKAPAVSWMPSPLPSPPRPRRLLEARSLRGPPAARAPAPGLDSGYGFRGEEVRGSGLVPNLNTHSSSSIPAEAIQAEVQKQLGGLLDRLQEAELTNARLQEELELVRRTQREEALQPESRGSEVPFGGSRVGDPPAPREGDREQQGHPLRHVQGGCESQEDPGLTARSRPDPWRDPLGALWEELQTRRAASPEAREIRPQGANQPEVPRLGVAGDPTTNAILEALTKNLTSLQELQAKSIMKEIDSEESPEQVKSTPVTLPLLPGPEGMSAGIVFQDWLAQVAVPMQDLSASSGAWWADVVKLVKEAYSKWLSATPIERLKLEPTGTSSERLSHEEPEAVDKDIRAEWDAAVPVKVNLAGGESVSLKMNEAGTILVPRHSPTSATSTSPIVPLGALVSQLGYTMTWGKTKCRLVGRNGEVINLRVREGCPEITEHEALKLIAQLEDSRLQELRTNTADTRQRVRAAALAMERNWFDHLISYVDSELASEALKAVDAAPFLKEVPQPCKADLVDALPEANGWQSLRGLEHLNRRMRKRLWSSNKWIVHVFAGKEEKRDLHYLEGHGYVILDLDIERGKTHDVLRPGTWRALEYAA